MPESPVPSSELPVWVWQIASAIVGVSAAVYAGFRGFRDSLNKRDREHEYTNLFPEEMRVHMEGPTQFMLEQVTAIASTLKRVENCLSSIEGLLGTGNRLANESLGQAREIRDRQMRSLADMTAVLNQMSDQLRILTAEVKRFSGENFEKYP